MSFILTVIRILIDDLYIFPSKASPSICYCYEKSILAKQINNSIYVYIYLIILDDFFNQRY